MISRAALFKRSQNVLFNGRRMTNFGSPQNRLPSQRHLAALSFGGSSCWIPSVSVSGLLKRQESRESCPNNSSILACSSSATMMDNRVFYKRWIRRFQWWLQSIWDLLLVATRTSEVALRLSPLIILSPVATLSGSHIMKDWSWRYLVSAVQGCGPVAIKFAQWMATRRDMFPPVLCDRLGVLHDRGYPHGFSHTDKVLKDAFGDYQSKGLQVHPDDVVGCGSAAQVYRGTLTIVDNKTGEKRSKEVAIKVLHPNFQQQVGRDLQLIERLARFAHSLPSEIIKMLNLPRATETFGSTLWLQADLSNEGRNLNQFRKNFYDESKDKEGKSSIIFPKPIDGWSSPKVLVEDYIDDAIPISHFLKDSSPGGIAIRKELAGPLLRAFLKMVFIDNFVHGDLHNGNVLVKTTVVDRGANDTSFGWLFGGKDSSNESQDRSSNQVVKRSIIFLDAGIANSLSPDDQRNLRDLFRAVIFNEGDRAGRLMVERAKYERCSQVPGGIDAFAKGVEEIVSEFHDRRKEGLTLGAVRIGGLLSRVLDLCRIHGVEIDPAMASVVISTLVLEGLGRSLSPELNLIDFAHPFLIGRGSV